MKENKQFSDQELALMGKRTLDLLVSAIEEEDSKKAKKLAQRMYNEFQGMHDLYRDWLTDLFTFVGNKFGDSVLSDSLQETVAGMTRRLSGFYKDKTAEQKLQILTAGLRGHLQAFEIVEDDEKYTIIAECCGSGGRLITEGKYEPPHNFLKIKEPQDMTFNRPDFPVYCAHCYFQNISPAEAGGDPLFITEPAKEPGKGPCRLYLYK